ncbi:MAG: hypothetical protein DRQ55_04735 [Planctomycetota bacterium]|nr:MAG: hypothetical protein DRQ55_04735 [Planctomycetota bacterium]
MLVAAYVVQTWMVYSDPAGREAPPLSTHALRGREIWHEHNCQSCHQLYGFGGFLGPDLTNAADWLTAARMDTILVDGAGQMPAFDLDLIERRSLGAYLQEIAATGRGQARVAVFQPPVELFASTLADATPPRGRDIALQQNCVACHLPNHASDYRAPDLTTAITRLGREGVRAVLEQGVPGKAMPRFGFSPQDLEALLDFMEWLGENGELVRTALAATKHEDGDWSLAEVPWWEF